MIGDGPQYIGGAAAKRQLAHTRSPRLRRRQDLRDAGKAICEVLESVICSGDWPSLRATYCRGPDQGGVINAPTGAVYTEQVLVNDNPQVLGLVYGINAPDELVRPLP